MLQGPNKFKNRKLWWLFKPLRLAKFESLWIQVCSLVAVWGSRTMFSLYFLSFWILIELSQGFFTLIHCCWRPFTVGCFPFYNTILRFLKYHWFPLFALLGIRTNVVLAILVAGPFLILHYFLLFRFLLQKPPSDFPLLGGS